MGSMILLREKTVENANLELENDQTPIQSFTENTKTPEPEVPEEIETEVDTPVNAQEDSVFRENPERPVGSESYELVKIKYKFLRM